MIRSFPESLAPPQSALSDMTSRSSALPPLPGGFLQNLARALPPGRILEGSAELESYAWDNTGLRFPPQAVILAENREEVATTLKHCSDASVPVIPRGAGTGNVGGVLPVQGGVILSTQRMNTIVEIAAEDRLAVVQPGVVNGDLQAALAPHGLFWPPDPSSSRSCTIGGNIAMCAAGPRAVRHGVTRDWVLGLEAVLADGRVIHTGGRTSKGVVGYDLTRLLIGSEGTLGVVTEATLKLSPIPRVRRLARGLFASVADATRTVSALMASNIPLCAIEFLDPASLDLLRQDGRVAIPPEGQAMLLLEMCGSRSEVEEALQKARDLIEPFNPLEWRHARSDQEAAQIWEARYVLSPILKKLAPRRINEDVVVPVSRLPELIAGLQDISRESGLPIVNFGHAGNGNIHVNLLVDPKDPQVMAQVSPALDRVFRLVLDLDGSLSGEHGVGSQKLPYVAWELDEGVVDLHRQIKKVFDPKGIMNPGKVFPA
ncbi:MAG: FAD-binding protein [Magnetococcales bacterium]|nr:FAD-binding protein [Magnetococcales bacterium]